MNLRPSGYECTDARGSSLALIGVLPDHVAFSRPAHGTVVCVGGIPLVLVVLYACCTGRGPERHRTLVCVGGCESC